MPKSCKAEFHAADQTLVCSLPEGHDGPVHASEGAYSWGDVHLPVPADLANAAIDEA